MSGPEPGLVIVGRVSGLFGVRGWVRVHSWTDPPENVLRYSPWWLGSDAAWTRREPAGGRRQRGALVAALAGVEDRDAARRLLGAAIAVRREQLPELGPGEYYWADLLGLEVLTTGGVALGTVGGLLETGANDVLVVHGERERLIPYISGEVIREVDLPRRRIRVDWDPDF